MKLQLKVESTSVEILDGDFSTLLRAQIKIKVWRDLLRKTQSSDFRWSSKVLVLWNFFLPRFDPHLKTVYFGNWTLLCHKFMTSNTYTGQRRVAQKDGHGPQKKELRYANSVLITLIYHFVSGDFMLCLIKRDRSHRSIVIPVRQTEKWARIIRLDRA